MTVREVSERWMAGWNEKDADALAALVADDLEYYDPAWPELMHGPGDVRTFTSAMWRAMPDMQFSEPAGLIGDPDGERAAVPWRMTATFTGVLDPPGYAPTGAAIELEGVDVFELRDGKIARLATHYDALEVGRQVGVMPARGSRADRMGVKGQRLLAKLRRR